MRAVLFPQPQPTSNYSWVSYLTAGLVDPVFLPFHPFLATFENHSIVADRF